MKENYEKFKHLKYDEINKLIFDPKRLKYVKLKNDAAELYAKEIFNSNSFEECINSIVKKSNSDNKSIIYLKLEKFIKNCLYSEIDRFGQLDVDQSLEFPNNIEIELTSACNWNCGFCYNIWKKDNIKFNKHLDYKVIFSVLDECEKNGCYTIRYSGGEPMLHPKFKEIIAYGKSKGLNQILFTNGTLLTTEIISYLERNNVSF